MEDFQLQCCPPVPSRGTTVQVDVRVKRMVVDGALRMAAANGEPNEAGAPLGGGFVTKKWRFSAVLSFFYPGYCRGDFGRKTVVNYIILGWSADFFGFTVGRISLRKGAVNGLIGWVPISSYIFQECKK